MTPTISPSMRVQDVPAISVSILSHPTANGAPDSYLARVQLKVRYRPEVHANFSGARCRQVAQRLAKDVSEGNFWLKRAGKDLELLLTAAGEGVTSLPPRNPQGFVQILPQKSRTPTIPHAARCSRRLRTLIELTSRSRRC
jgi:hypothetical protein